MDLTRRQVAAVFAALYMAGGALLLMDFLAASSAHGAHLPLAWHVYPVALAAQIVALATTISGPLDAEWPLSTAAMIAAYVPAVLLCAVALFRVVSGRFTRGPQ